MKLFLDTANLTEIKQANEWGLLDGVTTNPSLIAKEMKNSGSFKDIVTRILKETPGPVSIEVIAEDYDNMLKQAFKISELGKNAVVKVPFTTVGLKVTKALSDKGIPVNSTLIFSGIQALFAAKAGARYVSPFVGRLDDIAEDGMSVIEQIKTIYTNYDMKTNILVASIRSPLHVLRSMIMGADVITLPFDVLSKLPSHPKTTEGLTRFLDDWKKAFGNMDFPL